MEYFKPGGLLFPQLAVAKDNEFCAGQFFKPHRTTGVNLVC